jgi:hypothetical protein
LKVKLRPGGWWGAGIYVSTRDHAFVLAFWNSLLDEGLAFSDPQHYTVAFPQGSSEQVQRLFEALRGQERGTIVIGN